MRRPLATLSPPVLLQHLSFPQVASVERRLADGDPGVEATYLHALEELRGKVSEWEAAHGVPFMQRGKALQTVIATCLAAPRTAGRLLNEILTPGPEPAAQHKLVRACACVRA